MSKPPTAEDYSLPGKYGKVMAEVQRGLQQLRSSETGGQEIERKFLIKGKTANLKAKTRIEQVYLGNPTDELEVRIRKTGDDVAQKAVYELTVKMGALPARREETIEVAPQMFWAAYHSSDASVLKFRSRVTLPGGKTAEVDQFEDPDLEKALVEVEFDSKEEAESFDIDQIMSRFSFLGEVTETTRWTNQNIAQRNAQQ